jgi:hypothetical protein
VTHPYDEALPPEPGTVVDLDHGVDEPAAPLPDDDSAKNEPTLVNDYEDDE